MQQEESLLCAGDWCPHWHQRRGCPNPILPTRPTRRCRHWHPAQLVTWLPRRMQWTKANGAWKVMKWIGTAGIQLILEGRTSNHRQGLLLLRSSRSISGIWKLPKNSSSSIKNGILRISCCLWWGKAGLLRGAHPEKMASNVSRSKDNETFKIFHRLRIGTHGNYRHPKWSSHSA